MATLLRRLPSCVDAAPVRRGGAGARSRTASSPRGSRHGTASSVAAVTRIPAARTTTPLDGAARPQAHLTRSLRDGSWLSVAGLRPNQRLLRVRSGTAKQLATEHAGQPALHPAPQSLPAASQYGGAHMCGWLGVCATSAWLCCRGTRLPATGSVAGNSNLVSYQLSGEPNNGV
ncbi:unnamed protein product [Urochloa humidicola]